MQNLLFFSLHCADTQRRKQSRNSPIPSFFPTDADIYPASGLTPLQARWDRVEMHRMGRTDGLDALYDSRYLSEDPQIREIELLVLDEICTHSKSLRGDPFDLFSEEVGRGQCVEPLEDEEEPFLDLSSIPLDNFHSVSDLLEEEHEVDPQIFPLPPTVANRVPQALPKPKQTVQPAMPAPVPPPLPTRQVEESDVPPPKINTEQRTQLMQEIRASKDTPKPGFVRREEKKGNSSDDSFFAHNEPLNLRRKSDKAKTVTHKKNSLHAHINEPKSSSVVHSDSFREAVSFAMQHRRSKLREDSKNSDVSIDASNDSHEFV